MTDTSSIERVWRLRAIDLEPMIKEVSLIYVKHGHRMKLTADEANISLADMGWIMRRTEWAVLVKEAEKARMQRLEYDADDALRSLVEIGMADQADCYDPVTNALLPIHEIPPATRRCIKTYDAAKGKVTMMDKGPALTILANKFGHNIQRHQHQGADPVEVLFNSLPPHLRPPGLERRGIRVWDAVDAEVVRPELPGPGETKQ